MNQHKPYWNRMVPELTVTDFSRSLDLWISIKESSVSSYLFAVIPQISPI